MKHEYLLVHKSILPDYYEQIIKCRELVEGKNLSTSEACKMCNISRSTYYKYKDFIFELDENKGDIIVLSCRLIDKQGVLSKVLNTISEYNCNIITINQNAPINNVAQTIITINIKNINSDIKNIINEINNLEGVKLVEILAYK
jgi:chorismate mutase